MKSTKQSDTPETDAAFDALSDINMGSTLPEMMDALEKAHALGKAKFEELERDRNRLRDELYNANLRADRAERELARMIEETK